MSRTQRLGLLGVAAVIAVVAFVLLQPEEAPRERAAPQPAQTPLVGQDATGGPSGRTDRPEVEQIRVDGGEPVGGVQELSARSSETVRFAVRSDVADEVHVHGYDRSRPVGPSRPARFEFPAELEGVFEVELEQRGLEIAELTVEPL